MSVKDNLPSPSPGDLQRNIDSNDEFQHQQGLENKKCPVSASPTVMTSDSLHPLNLQTGNLSSGKRKNLLNEMIKKRMKQEDNLQQSFDSNSSKVFSSGIENLTPSQSTSQLLVVPKTEQPPNVSQVVGFNRDTGFLESFRSFVTSSQHLQEKDQGSLPRDDTSQSSVNSTSNLVPLAQSCPTVSSAVPELSDASSARSAESNSNLAKLKKWRKDSRLNNSGLSSIVNKSNFQQNQDTSMAQREQCSMKEDILQKNYSLLASETHDHKTQGATIRQGSNDVSSDAFYSREKSLKLIRQFPVGRRGRRPKFMRGNFHETHKRKYPVKFSKPSLIHLKQTGEQFLQDAYCCEVAPRLPKCRECRMSLNHRSKKMQNIFCRFYAYRKLCYGKNGTIMSAGFSEPIDAKLRDFEMWLPPIYNTPTDLDIETSKFLLTHVGDQFCDLVEQERDAMSLHMAEDKTITWKRVVQGVREMCDVCETTLFNFHWVCHRCGFVVCIDCYKAKKNDTSKVQNEEDLPKDRDEYEWLLCNGRHPHEQDKLMMTQIIAGTALWDLAKTLHKVRERWNIPAYCRCVPKEVKAEEKPFSNGICKQLMCSVTKTFSTDKHKSFNHHSKLHPHEENNLVRNSLNGLTSVVKQEGLKNYYNSEIGNSALRWLADVALDKAESTQRTLKSEEIQNKTGLTNQNSICDEESQANSFSNRNESFMALRELLIKPTDNTRNGEDMGMKKNSVNTLDEVIACVIEQQIDKGGKNNAEKPLIHFTRRQPQPRNGRDPLPIRICSLAESMLLYPDIPHSWFCNGRLLLLHDPQNFNNIKLFQEQWKRGQPILVANVDRSLNMSLWHPDGFCRDFGDVRNDLVNCKTGNILPNLPMRKFWEGFENFSKRMKDEHGDYMLLKLKDWPPGEDFSELLPSRFEDLMKVLPLPQYTHRNGVLNLAGRLPECFVRPDLGPKMYNAYGSALYPTKGTTNLHLDISDAVNVMVYVGIPKDGKDEEHIQAALKAIDEGGCDSLMRKRVREKGVKPGALWHIYNARDADKIRDLLNKVAVEQGEKLEAHHDPIHDQSWYLDVELRERLYREYAVEGYAIAQCLGDSVFIPAGAPHQVRNLHSCVKVAEDFVSPENIAHCFTLTQEFRQLSDTHTNHEDKLQIKNIIYHTVKDALSLLRAYEIKESAMQH